MQHLVRPRLAVGLGLVCLLLAAACQSGPSHDSQKVVVTREDQRLPQGCRPAEVANFLLRFLDVFNRGDQRQVTTFFTPTFSWYVVSDRIGGVQVSSRDELLKYFARRHAQHEQLRLRKIRVTGSNPPGNGEILFLLTRQADDLGGRDKRALVETGKGSISCQKQTIDVWAMDGGGDHFRECPEPAQAAPSGAVIACARTAVIIPGNSGRLAVAEVAIGSDPVEDTNRFWE